MKHLLLIIISLLSFSFYGQERQNPNREHLTFDMESKTTINEVDGWKFDSDSKQWIRNTNLIFQSNKDIDVTDYMKSNQCQTLKWIQLKSLKYNHKRYYVLLYERLTGHYKYPTTQDGWEIENSTMFFVLDSIQYLNLINVINKKENKDFKITSNNYGTISDYFGGYDNETLLEKIWHTFQAPHKTNRCFILNSQILNKEDIIRFRLPEIDNCTNYNLYGSLVKISSSNGPGYFEAKQSVFTSLLTTFR